MLTGYLRKMAYTGLDPVDYVLKYANYNSQSKQQEVHEADFRLHELIGQKIRLEFSGEIRCMHCARKSRKSFNRGYCYPCFQKLAKNDLCMVKPELCHYHQGTCREPEWGQKNCFQSHILYLANTSGVKVGITREKPYTNRWIDQGAMYALPVMELNSRQEAGLWEQKFAKYISDKTAWQKMISTASEYKNLQNIRDELIEKLAPEQEIAILPAEEYKITYPISQYPQKKKSYKPEKNGPLEDVLHGIKGQYLLFSDGVINIRAYAGYQFHFQVIT